MSGPYRTITDLIEAAGHTSPCDSEEELLDAIEDGDTDVMEKVGEALTAFAEQHQARQIN